MKKKLSFLLVLFMAVFLVACNNETNEIPQFDNSLVENNSHTLPDSSKIDKNLITDISSKQMGLADIQSMEYAECGVIVTRNNTNHIGFYSLLVNDYITGNYFYDKWVEYSVNPVSNFGAIIEVNYKGKTLLFDTFGNNLISTENNYNTDTDYRYLAQKINDKVYLTITNHSNYGDKQYFEYDNFVAKSVYNLPKQQVDKPTDNTIELKPGQQYVDLTKQNLDEYGLTGHYFSYSNGLYTLFNQNNEKISTFYIPNDANTSKPYIIGNKLIYQQLHELPKDTLIYEVLYRDVKYDLNSYQIDLLNGKKVEIELDYIIEDFVPYKDKENLYNLGLVNVSKIVDNHTESSISLLINSNGKVVSDVSGLELDKIIKLNDKYYNVKTNVLYDSNFTEIAYLAAINPQIDLVNKLFVGQLNGAYGAVDFAGKVAIPFEYLDLDFEGAQAGYILGVKEDGVYSINTKSFNANKVADRFQKLGNGLYVTTKGYDRTYFNATGNELLRYDAQYSRPVLDISFSTLFENFHFNIYKYSDSNNKTNYSINSLYSGKCNVVSNSYQYDYDSVEKDGTIEKLAIDLSLGTNNFTIPKNTNRLYFTYRSTKKAYYTISNESNLSLSGVYYYPEDDPKTTVDESKTAVPVIVDSNRKDNSQTVRFEKDVTYYFNFSISYSYKTIYTNFDFKCETGEKSLYPIIDIVDNVEYNLPIHEKGTYFEFESTEAIKYDFTGLEKCTISTVGSKESFNGVKINLSRKIYKFKVLSSNKTEKLTIKPDLTNVPEGATHYNRKALTLNKLENLSLINKVFNYTYTNNTGSTQTLLLNSKADITKLEVNGEVYTPKSNMIKLYSKDVLNIRLEDDMNSSVEFALFDCSKSLITENYKENVFFLNVDEPLARTVKVSTTGDYRFNGTLREGIETVLYRITSNNLEVVSHTNNVYYLVSRYNYLLVQTCKLTESTVSNIVVSKDSEFVNIYDQKTCNYNNSYNYFIYTNETNENKDIMVSLTNINSYKINGKTISVSSNNPMIYLTINSNSYVKIEVYKQYTYDSIIASANHVTVNETINSETGKTHGLSNMTQDLLVFSIAKNSLIQFNRINGVEYYLLHRDSSLLTEVTSDSYIVNHMYKLVIFNKNKINDTVNIKVTDIVSGNPSTFTEKAVLVPVTFSANSSDNLFLGKPEVICETQGATFTTNVYNDKGEKLDLIGDSYSLIHNNNYYVEVALNKTETITSAVGSVKFNYQEIIPNSVGNYSTKNYTLASNEMIHFKHYNNSSYSRKYYFKLLNRTNCEVYINGKKVSLNSADNYVYNANSYTYTYITIVNTSTSTVYDDLYIQY